MTKKKFDPEFMYVGQKLDVYRNGGKVGTVKIKLIEENQLNFEGEVVVKRGDWLIVKDEDKK